MWEHAHGIRVATVGNPGWEVKPDGASAGKVIDLPIERDESDWISVRTTETEFAGYGGPRNLPELLVLAVDLSWDGDEVKTSNDDGRGVR